MPRNQWRWRDIRAGTEFSLQRNGILESAPPEPIHCERRQHSSWNQDAQLRFAAGEGRPGNRRVSSVHGRPQEAWRGVSTGSTDPQLEPLTYFLIITRDARVSWRRDARRLRTKSSNSASRSISVRILSQ